MEHEVPTDRPSRRALLRAAGLAVAGAALGACAADDRASAPTGEGSGPTTAAGATGPAPTTPAAGGSTVPAGPTTALTPADFDGLATCVLLPEKTAGPFPLDRQLDRRDITEGVPGQPMRLGLRVVDAACAPVPGAAVEVWHCDATGDYSAFADGGGGKDEAEGSTFLRGTQTTGEDGIVELLSIVPGWYRGRAVHVHLRVHLGDRTVLTSQLFFDPAHLATVYAAAPYAAFGPPDTSNERDGIAGDPAAEGTLLHTVAADTTAGPGTLALANLGIDRSATSSEGGPPARGPRAGRRAGADRPPPVPRV